VVDRNAWSEFKISNRNYISGEALHFLLDASGLGLEDITVSHIGPTSKESRLGQIVEPNFSVEPKEFLARLYAIIVSDGTVFPDGRLAYYETRVSRYERVKSLIRQLGDVAIRDKFNPTDVNELYIPPIIGRMLIRVGMPTEAKCIENRGLPEFILEGEEHILRAYLEEVIPEDGYFSSENLRFSITRGTVLLKPGVDSKISPEQLEVVLRHGETKYLTFGHSDRKYEVVQIQTSSVIDLVRSSDQVLATTSTRLLYSIFKESNQLIRDERRICTRLGINTRIQPEILTYYVDTGRFSSSWVLYTSSLRDAMKWALKAPPNDVFKYSRVREFIESRPDLHPNN
jgi:hypothetical protein